MLLSKCSELTQRLILSSLGLLLLLGLISFAYHPFFQFVCVAATAAVSAVALWEYYQMVKAKGFYPLGKIAIISAIAYIIAVYLSILWPFVFALPLFVFAAFFLISFLYFFFKDGDTNSLVNLATTTFGFIYLIPSLSCVLYLLYSSPFGFTISGQWWLIYALTVTKMTDVGAYFSGKKFGKHSLAQHLSPKKTIEGAIGGLFSSIAASVLLPFLAILFTSENALKITLWQSVYLGFFISILAQVGDLGESLLKRDAGVKGSNQLPGLGGMLDIVDSLIFTLPFIYFFVHILV